jgi:nitrite reductase/ring-hydroxylating ferredoxin subunit
MRAAVDRPVIMGDVSRLVRIASVGEIPVGRGKTVEVDGLPIAVFNAGAGLYHATDGSCPHEGGPLADGALLGDSAVCPWHGFDFDVRTGACGVAPDLSVTVYPVRVTDGDIVVELP